MTEKKKASEKKSVVKKDVVTVVVDGHSSQVERHVIAANPNQFVKDAARQHGISTFKVKVDGRPVGGITEVAGVQKIEVSTHDVAA